MELNANCVWVSKFVRSYFSVEWILSYQALCENLVDFFFYSTNFNNPTTVKVLLDYFLAESSFLA